MSRERCYDKMKLKNLEVILQLIIIQCVVGEPISFTIGAVTAISSVLYYGRCYVTECCSDKYMPGDFSKLENVFKRKLYGQHIAEKIVINALKSHWNSKHVQKPLTLSFHGLPGTGKNYVSKHIQDAIYSEGSKSKYVHHFMGRIHFPLKDKVKQYQDDLYSWIKGNVSNCDKQLFIFDEVDKMPSGILNIIKPMVDYNENVDKVDYRKCIFIFLSNTGSGAITAQYLNLWRQGYKREDIKLKDFEKIITEGAFNEEGGFHHSDTIKSNLIDHYVPFLPMEYMHVKRCIENEFEIRNVTPSPKQLDEVLEYVEWGPSPEDLFSKTGCKRLSQKVAVVAARGDDIY